ncbi:putative ribonuclease H-like domain-containing protein [Tanacetum coccineum]
MRPFGCPVTILNTIDHLGKFDGKADEGFFVGYSTNSKAFRVFNSRTRIVEENMHVKFSEETPNIVGNGPNWLFDIDALTKSMNYEPVVAGNQSNGIADPPFSSSSKDSPDAGFKPSGERKRGFYGCVDDQNMPNLEEIVYSEDGVGAEADINNLDIFMPVSPILTTIIHKDHPFEQIIRDLHSAPQTRRMTMSWTDTSEPKKVIEALKDPSWIEAMQEDLLQFKLQQVWTLVDLPYGKRAIGTKWVYMNKKDKRGIVIRNKARIEAIRLFLAYASFKDFVVYQMDVKSAFLYERLKGSPMFSQPPGFEDLEFPNRVYKVEKALYDLHQAPRAWFLQLFLNNQIENLEAVFNDEYDTPSHTKKVFANMRRQGKDFSGTVTPLFATMLIQPQAVEGEGSGQPTEPQHTPTTASPSNIEPIPIIASSSQPQKTHKHRKTKRPTEISQSSRPTTLVADETVYEERGDSMERAANTAASLDAEQDNGNIIRTQSMATLNEPIPQGTGSGSGPRCQDTILGDRPAQTRFERLSKQSNDPPLSGVNTPGSGEDRLKIMELMEIYTKLSDMVLALENVKTAQDLEITSLKKREDASKQGRNMAESDQDEEISFVQEDAETQGRYDQDIDVTTVSAPITTTGVSVSTAEPSTPPTTTTVIEDEDLTIAQTLMKMRSEKSKEKAKERIKRKI